MIADNLEMIRSRICAACERAGRAPESVKLIAVSKFHPASEVEEAYAAGQLAFGENRAQEMVEKKEALAQLPLNWHFIGTLQRNKVKYVVGNAVLIHSVNSEELLHEIERIAAKKAVTADILVEVNIADETTKSGAGREEALTLVRLASSLEHIRVKGLMCIAPPVEEPGENRPYFKAMRELAAEISEMKLPNISMEELSMGMSGDFETAVEEGSTMVRVGTAIFGARNYEK